MFQMLGLELGSFQVSSQTRNISFKNQHYVPSNQEPVTFLMPFHYPWLPEIDAIFPSSFAKQLITFCNPSYRLSDAQFFSLSVFTHVHISA